ncbi:c-type cytochrome biogenesis protein CcmI [Pelomonas cellulosilytica]|uniref:C-type cytochrome biogenesis protein CcmI n=1 Tax=Pelomonas cellulosilytica TaxID=2906762 RepID=A0ABS8XM76_9BURK|nr:c-type cytochrome biogenesis protein CcmI [Pelomonas sp. P8]MCE4552908.1 c-type cytochrome biogenesis protein CcmI [Pelomonas sp. P8]
MLTFLLEAGLLVALTLLMLLRPWKRAAAARVGVDARDLTVRLYRDQLAELDSDLAAGTLRDEDHATASAELQRRLLEDADGLATPADARPAGRTPWVLAAALPLLAASLYAGLGTPAALSPPAAPNTKATSAGAAASPAQVDRMLAELAARAEKDPGNSRNWIVLARSFRLLGRLPDSARAFGRVVPAELDASPALLVEYADVLGALANGNLEGRPLRLVNQALAIDSNHVPALSLFATAALSRGDRELAISTWERALALAPAGSEDAKWLAQVLADARTNASATAASTTAAAPLAPTAITGQIRVDTALAAQVRPEDTLFVYARPVDGRLPLAVLRTRAGMLPLAFTLDDSLAMSPTARLSDAARVRVDARISRSGNAMPAPGDLVAEGQVVATGARGLVLFIDRVQP